MTDIGTKIEVINAGLEGFVWTRRDETPEQAAWEVLHDGYHLCDEGLRGIVEVYIHLRKADEEGRAPDLAVLKQLDVMESECLKRDGCGGLEEITSAEELKSN
jgi:hypothetical protein